MPAPVSIEPNAYSRLDDAFASFRLNGSALPSRFEVMIYPPDSAGISNGDAQNAGMRCESISLPGKNLTTSSDSNMYGVQPMIVDGVSFAGTANMIFTSSRDLRERKMFEDWQSVAWDKVTWNIGYYKDYIGTVDIFLLEQAVDGFKRSYGIRLEEAYPKEINGNDLSAGPATAALKLTIQMQYKYWTEVTRQIDKPTSNLADF